MTDKKIVLTTVGTREEGQKIARGLVERRQAACVNIIGPIESVYRWKGVLDGAEEYLLIIKTTAEAFSGVHQTIAELHSYELPECIEVPIEGGSEEYLGWIGENVET